MDTMNDIKCECGHVNPHGTILCESCGKPLKEETKKEKLVDMRYEGTARRSQTYNRTIIDKVWNFFSSVKVAVVLIVITLIASIIGTIFPQEIYIPGGAPAETYYEEQYGFIGKLYYLLGFHNLYSSWWYLLLIASIGTSLVICSIDRAVPLYRALKKQKVTRHESFLSRQRIFGVTKVDQSTDDALNKVKEQLKAKKYNVREENGNLLAEKGRFSRWGPYVNHCGLIIFLIGAMLRFVPGMYVDEMLWLREGETKAIPGTNGEFYLENKEYTIEFYDEEDNKVFSEALKNAGTVPKTYQSDVVLYKSKSDIIGDDEGNLEKVKEYSIRVNEPLKFNGYAIYQMSYKLDELSAMKFTLEHKESKEQFGTIEIDLGNGYSVEILSYFPDFEFNQDGEPTTKSRTPNNPAFIFQMFTPDKKEGEVSFVAIMQTVEPLGDNDYKLTLTGVDTIDVTGLNVKKDSTLWILGVGGFIFMIGLIQGSFWYHRRIWIQRNGDEIWVAGHTNKNWYGFQREISSVFENTTINEPVDQLEEKTS